MNKIRLILFIFVFALSLYSITKTISDIHQKSKRVTDIESEIAGLEKENEVLTKDLAYKNSKEFVEKEAREKLFMGIPGEKMLIIPQNFFENLGKGNPVENSSNETQKPIWKQWVALLF